MKILITGHKGFIGQNLTFYLQKDHELFGYEWQEEHLPEVEGFDQVIHVGAISSTTETDVNKVMLQNYEFTKWLYNQCNTKGVNFQYASSASIYGSGTEFKEDSPPNPQSPYAWSKYLFDRWVWQQDHKVCVQGFRYFNVYGPLEDHKGNQASPVTKFTKQAKDAGKITLFFGSDNFKRDFVFIGDVCEAHKQLMENKEAGLYNIGTGVATSFEEVGELIATKNNAEIKYIEMPDNLKGQYQEYTCADTAKLNSVTDIKFTTVKDFVNG